MSHHIQEPAIKQIGPVDIVARNTGSKLADAVATVPTDIHAEKEIFDRVENRNTVGVQITGNIPVPKVESFESCVHGDAVARAVGDRTEAKTERVSFAIFGDGCHRVVTKLVSALHKFFCPEFQFLFG